MWYYCCMSKNNKLTGKIMLEIAFTIVVAYFLSLLVSIITFFVLGNIDKASEYEDYANYASGIVFGLAFGYKLKEIVSRKK